MKKYIQTREGAAAVGNIIRDYPLGEYGICVEILEQTRTLRQNNGIYLYFEWLAKALNDKQLTIQMRFLGKDIEVEWNKESVKSQIWQPVMLAMFNKTSTTKLLRTEVSAIYDTLNRHFIDKHDIYVPFPDRFEQR